MAHNVLQLPAVGDFWYYFSNISLNFLPAQFFNKPLNRQLLVGAVMGCLLVPQLTCSRVEMGNMSVTCSGEVTLLFLPVFFLAD
jgi:hypothetical protein